jgi:hypothetical protein
VQCRVVGQRIQHVERLDLLCGDAAVRALRPEDPKAERLELQGVDGRDAERLQPGRRRQGSIEVRPAALALRPNWALSAAPETR